MNPRILITPGAGQTGAATPEHEHQVQQVGHFEIGGIDMNAERRDTMVKQNRLLVTKTVRLKVEELEVR